MDRFRLGVWLGILWIIQWIKNGFKAPTLEDTRTKPKPRKVHKKYDTTPFTQMHYDFIVDCFTEFQAYNELMPRQRKTQQDLANVLNEKTGLDKSVNAYARIWRGQVDRDSLARGNETFSI